MKKSILNLGSRGIEYIITWVLKSDKGKPVIINIQGDFIGDESFIDALAKRLDEALRKK